MTTYREVHTSVIEEPTVTAAQPAVVESEHRMNVAARLVYLIGGVIITLLALRFLLALLGANPNNGFANFIYTLSHPFAAPFFSLFSYDQTLGSSRFELGTLVAIVVYALLTALLARLVTIGSRRPTV
jgi:uncharacterized protein YggT (Ycf19 family)